LDVPSTSPGSTDTKIDFSFQSLDLFIQRSFLGGEDTKAGLYGSVGVSWMFLVYKERYLAANPGTLAFPLEDGHNRSFTLNALLGTEYKLGRVAVYAEGIYGHPTRRSHVKETFNTLAPRLGLQLGVKLPLN
jgi:hypothetical protein